MNPEFSLVRKGYNRYEVEQFVLQASQEIEMLRSQVAHCEQLLRDKDAALEKANADLRYIGDTMVRAELAAREIIEEAEKRAGEVENRRREEADTRIRLLDEKKQELEEMRKRMEYLLRAQLALLEKE